MRTKITLKIAFYLVLLIVSCDTDDSAVFDQIPNDRINSKIDELKNELLLSPGGYRVIYYPKSYEFGGFTFFMKFDKEGNVEMTSNVDENIDIVSSKYEVSFGTSIELVFSTRNHIHKLSDSNFSGLIGSGYKGNSVFEYVGKQDGNLSFWESRNDSHLLFEPIEQEDWNSIGALLKMEENFELTSVYKFIEIQDNGIKERHDLVFNPINYYAKIHVKSSNGNISEGGFGIAYTKEGMRISPLIEFLGKTYQLFDYDEASSSFISKNGASKVIIGSSLEPNPFPEDDILVDTFDFFLFNVINGTSHLNSPGFNRMIHTVNNDIAVFEIEIGNIELNSQQFLDGVITMIIRVSSVNNNDYDLLRYSFNAIKKEGKLFLEYAGSINQSGSLLETKMKPILDFFGNSKGLIYEDKGDFTTDVLFTSLESGTFTSAEDPSIRIYGLWNNYE